MGIDHAIQYQKIVPTICNRNHHLCNHPIRTHWFLVYQIITSKYHHGISTIRSRIFQPRHGVLPQYIQTSSHRPLLNRSQNNHR
jgi:hypothetical protein